MYAETDSISTDDRPTKLWILMALLLQSDFVVSNSLYPISRYSLRIKTRRLHIHELRASSNRATFVSAQGTISNPRWTGFAYCYSVLSVWLVLTNPLQRAGPLLEHLMVAWTVNKLADPYGTWNFITIFTRVRHLPLSSLNAEKRGLGSLVLQDDITARNTVTLIWFIQLRLTQGYRKEQNCL